VISNNNKSDLALNVATISKEGGRPALATPLLRWRDKGNTNKVQIEGLVNTN